MPLAVGVIAFVFGWGLAKIIGLFRRKGPAVEPPTEHRHIRSLEASLRVAQKKADEMAEQFESTCVDFNALKEAHEELESAFVEREAKLAQARQAVRDETTKVQELRRELTERAEAKIRAEAQVREIETELSVMEAGSHAMSDEVGRPAAEDEQLAEQPRAATGGVAHPLDAAEDDDDWPAEEFLPDC